MDSQRCCRDIIMLNIISNLWHIDCIVIKDIQINGISIKCFITTVIYVIVIFRIDAKKNRKINDLFYKVYI